MSNLCFTDDLFKNNAQSYSPQLADQCFERQRNSTGSFLKFTAHEFKKMLTGNNIELSKYAVDAHNKKYEVWQRDSLAVHLYSRQVMLQKLNYIHLNPLAVHWNLVNNPWDYYYSSARYYEMNENNFDFLKDIWEEF
ncbi:MAG: hypothetical protein H7Z13_19670 [Ferruginibacter sp.]|nr:hypothetical protein [Ferruginibacter sp.]